MVADKGKKMKMSEKDENNSSEQIDKELVQSIEKLQEVQDELEKVTPYALFLNAPSMVFLISCRARSRFFGRLEFGSLLAWCFSRHVGMLLYVLFLRRCALFHSTVP